MKPAVCCNVDCFRFEEHSISMSCCYTDSCNGYQISATKQLFKELKKEDETNNKPSIKKQAKELLEETIMLQKQSQKILEEAKRLFL